MRSMRRHERHFVPPQFPTCSGRPASWMKPYIRVRRGGARLELQRPNPERCAARRRQTGRDEPVMLTSGGFDSGEATGAPEIRTVAHAVASGRLRIRVVHWLQRSRASDDGRHRWCARHMAHAPEDDHSDIRLQRPAVGRAIRLEAPLDPQGLLKRDLLNPDPR